MVHQLCRLIDAPQGDIQSDRERLLPNVLHTVQAAVEGAEDPEAALRGAGLFFNDGAVVWLTPGQKGVLIQELETMEVRCPSLSSSCN